MLYQKTCRASCKTQLPRSPHHVLGICSPVAGDHRVTWNASPKLRPYSQAVAAVSLEQPPRMATALQLLAMRLAVL